MPKKRHSHWEITSRGKISPTPGGGAPSVLAGRPSTDVRTADIGCDAPRPPGVVRTNPSAVRTGSLLPTHCCAARGAAYGNGVRNSPQSGECAVRRRPDLVRPVALNTHHPGWGWEARCSGWATQRCPTSGCLTRRRPIRPSRQKSRGRGFSLEDSVWLQLIRNWSFAAILNSEG